MRKKRRVTVEIEHREISFSAGPGGIAPQGARKERELVRATRPLTCPTCSGEVVLSLAEAMAEPGFTQAMLERRAAGTGLHMGQFGSGEWWVCKGSIQGR